MDRMSAREIAEWRAYSDLEMLPSERLEFLLGVLTTVLVNVNRDEDSDPAEISDFMPWLRLDEEDEEDNRPSQAEMLALIESLNATFGGRDERQPAGGVWGDGGDEADAAGNDRDDGQLARDEEPEERAVGAGGSGGAGVVRPDGGRDDAGPSGGLD